MLVSWQEDQLGQNLLCLSPLTTWCLRLMFEVVGTLGKARSWAGKKLLAQCLCWGNSHHPALRAAGGQLGVSALHRGKAESSSAHSRAAQTCCSRSAGGFPFTTSTQATDLVVVCVAQWGKERRASMGCACSHRHRGGGAGAAQTPMHLGFMSFLFCFVFFVLLFPSTVRY